MLDATTRDAAREKLKGYCRVCPVCNGKPCAGEVPGMGGAGSGASFRANVEALAARRLHMRTLHGVTDPDVSTTCLGREIDSPIQAAPMTGSCYNLGGGLSEEDFIDGLLHGAAQAGTLGWTGDGADPAMFDSGLAAITKGRGPAVAVIKPRAQDEIVARIRRAEQAGAAAVGVDVDGAGLVTMAQRGQPVGPKTPQEIEALARSTELPFALKGIMTVDEAEKARDAGCAAIVVSNHGGRVLDASCGVAEVLGEIAAAVGRDVEVLADGGVRSGSDALKLLALGARSVLVGRPLVHGVCGAGAEGVRAVLDAMRQQLYQAMLLTGTATCRDVARDILC
jgi:isopentenyl diphosphate isomerase/L-lactate dehydrogenase-like FMN-dependent dehydrogenase